MKILVSCVAGFVALAIAWHLSLIGVIDVGRYDGQDPPHIAKIFWPKKVLIPALVYRENSEYFMAGYGKVNPIRITDPDIGRYLPVCLNEIVNTAFIITPKWFLGQENTVGTLLEAHVFDFDLQTEPIDSDNIENGELILCYLHKKLLPKAD